MNNRPKLYCLILCTLFSGCGEPEHAEVTGKVTPNGTPMNNVRLSFMGESHGSGVRVSFSEGRGLPL